MGETERGERESSERVRGRVNAPVPTQQGGIQADIKGPARDQQGSIKGVARAF